MNWGGIPFLLFEWLALDAESEALRLVTAERAKAAEDQPPQ